MIISISSQPIGGAYKDSDFQKVAIKTIWTEETKPSTNWQTDLTQPTTTWSDDLTTPSTIWQE